MAKSTDLPSGQADQPASDTAGNRNAFSEFGSSFWRTGVLKSFAESPAQLAGLNPSHVETDDNVTGWLKLANVAGNAAGMLADMTVMNYASHSVIGKALKMIPESKAAVTFAEKTIARGLLENSITGAAYGGVFTPLEPGESQWHRLGQSLTDATTFATLGYTHGKVAPLVGNRFLGRLVTNASGGITGGLANTNLDAWMHGRVAGVKENVIGTAGFALGNVVLGESARKLGQGIDFGKTRMLDAINGVGERAKPQLDLLSMKELAQRGDDAALEQRLKAYYPQLQKAFPLPGEIETPETYKRYLKDPDFPWEMEQLLGPVKGGLQYQVLDVGGDRIKKAGWLEHIWVADSSRQEGLGGGMLTHVQNRVAAKGGDATFWEFNDPDKMSPEEIRDDAKGGITTQDRVDYWGNRGAYVVVVPSTGELAPYAQPGMDGGDPVPYLSLAWSKPGGLDGQTISKSDYLKVMRAAHSTIVDVDSDPTVAHYTSALDAVPDQELPFVRLSDRIRERMQALRDQEGSLIRALRWMGLDIDSGRS